MRKKLIILFSILIFLAVMIILNSVVFRIKRVTAKIWNEDDFGLVQKIQDNTPIDAQSVFFLDEQDIIDKLAISVPEVKITKLERVFPNKLIIHAIKRERVSYLLQGTKFFIISEDLYVIDIINTLPSNLPELISADDNIQTEELQKGDRLKLNLISMNDLGEMYKNIFAVGYEYLTNLQKIKYIRTTKDIYLQTKSGVIIHISGSESMLQKIQIAYSLYEHTPIYRASGVIAAYIDAEGNLKASYRPEEIII